MTSTAGAADQGSSPGVGQAVAGARSGTLVLVCGLPASGKTTTASALAIERAAIRLSPDDWMDALGFNLWESEIRDRVERLQWRLARDLLATGAVVIIEWGTWGRDERARLRAEAGDLGAEVELVLLDPPVEELWRRIQARDREEPPITRTDLEEWDRLFERPGDEELSGYHRVDSRR